MSKVLVLFSGGLDSTVCLAEAVRKEGKENVTALSVFYGQKHKKEIEAAERVVTHYGTKHISVDLAQVFAHSQSSLLSPAKEIGKGTYNEQLEKSAVIDTCVPFRNGMFISTAASVALSLGCAEIIYGAHKNDAECAYPDCSEEFFLSMKSAVYSGSGNQLILKAPFIDKTKKDIVAAGHKLNVPFELTWSCYEGKERPCGECATCLDRANAFKQNNLPDPLIKGSK